MGRTKRRGVGVDELLRIALALPEVEQHVGGPYLGIKVRNKGFAYLCERDEVVLVKATLDEQAALVADDPEAYEMSYTSGRFGWVSVSLARVDPAELDELITEAWRLTAPKRLVAAHDQETQAR